MLVGLLAAAVWRDAAAQARAPQGREEPADCAILGALPGPSSSAAEVAAARLRAERCLRDARSGGAADREAEALYALAELWGLEGAWGVSLEMAERAATVARAERLGGLAARADNARGDALYNLWRFEEALPAFARARAGFAALGDRLHESYALKNLGITHAALGRRDLAMIRLEESRARHPGGDDAFEVSVLGNLGTIYRRLGAPRAGRRAYEEALALARAGGRPSEVADVLGRLAYLSLELERSEEARQRFDEALAAAAAAGPTAHLWLLDGAAYAYQLVGDEAAAERALARAAADQVRLGNPLSACLALLQLGRFHEAREPARARRAYAEAEVFLERAGSHCRWQLLVANGRLARRDGDRDGAIERYLEAVALVEARWRRAVSDHERAVFAAAVAETVRDLVGLLVARGEERGAAGDRELAFAVLERVRAPGLTRAIVESRLPPAASVDRLEHDIRSLVLRLESGGLGSGEREELEDLLVQREAQLDEHLRNVRRAAGRRPELRPLSAGEALRLLPAEVALVSYLVAEEESLAFVLAGGELRVARLVARREEIAERVEGFVDLLREPRHHGWRRVGHRLYQDLVAPWIEELPAVTTLVIVPDPALGSLPFEALPQRGDGGEPLIERLAIAYAPSATALSELAAARRQEPLRMVVLAGAGRDGPLYGGRRLRALYEEDGHDLSPLPFGEIEARRVAAYGGKGARLVAPPEATEAWAKSRDLARATVLHFATHGLLIPGDPRRSALLLAADPQGSEDGFLQAREIERLHLAADLVVLSACRTARGQGVAPDAVQSLAEAFFRAGARSVVGTLWEVEDRAAMRLMTAFYRQLATGHGKAEALRQAKLELAASGAPPRDWAGFVLLGEAEGRVPLAPAATRYAGDPRAVAALLVVAATLLGGGWLALHRRRARACSAIAP